MMEGFKGAMSHQDIISLPWCVFCDYWESMAKKGKKKKDTNYFGSEKLAQSWQENKDKWLKGKQVM